MPDKIITFDRYGVFYAATPIGVKASILFFNGNNEAYVALADFGEVETETPKILPDGRLWVGYPLTSFLHILDLLRKQSSLQFRLAPSNTCSLETTTTQLVGEGG